MIKNWIKNQGILCAVLSLVLWVSIFMPLNVQASESDHIFYGTSFLMGDGVNVSPNEAYYKDGRLCMKCDIKNLTDTSVALNRYIVDVTNGSGELIATQEFDDLNIYINPNETVEHLFEFDSRCCIPNANLEDYYTEYECFYLYYN